MNLTQSERAIIRQALVDRADAAYQRAAELEAGGTRNRETQLAQAQEVRAYRDQVLALLARFQ